MITRTPLEQVPSLTVEWGGSDPNFLDVLLEVPTTDNFPSMVLFTIIVGVATFFAVRWWMDGAEGRHQDALDELEEIRRRKREGESPRKGDVRKLEHADELAEFVPPKPWLRWAVTGLVVATTLATLSTSLYRDASGAAMEEVRNDFRQTVVEALEKEGVFTTPRAVPGHDQQSQQGKVSRSKDGFGKTCTIINKWPDRGSPYEISVICDGDQKNPIRF